MLRTKLVTKCRVLGFHPIDAYYNRPIAFESMIFFQYFERFETDRIQKSNMTCYGVNMFGFYLYETTKVTRFIDFHPTHNTHGFFFDILLHNFTFRDERQLLSEHNTNKNYLLECYIRGLLPDVQAVQHYLSQYAHRNLIETEKHAQLLNRLLQDYPFLDPLTFLTMKIFHTN